ncbi:MAG: TolB family protein [Armatimonadota bacterium]
MRSPIIVATIVLALTAAHAQEPLASASFEGDLEGWELQLNRGAEVDVSYPEDAVLGEHSLRFEPQRLCAPDDIAAPTNIHIYLDSFRMEAGIRYELSAWAKADEAGRAFALGARRADAAQSLAQSNHRAGPQWQRFSHIFTVGETLDDGRLQIIAGGDERPITIDAVQFRALPEDALLPADHLAWEGAWDDPARWSAAAEFPKGGGVRVPGVATYRQPLPANYDLQMLVRAAEPTSLALLAGGEMIRSVELPAGELTQIVTVKQRGAAPAPELAFRAEGDVAVGIMMMKGHEMLPPRQEGDSERSEFVDPETGAKIIRLTHSPYEDKHAYYDVDPWSPDGSKIVFASALPDQRGSTVWLMNADGSDMRRIGESGYFSYHVGCFPIWAPDGESIYWRDFHEEDGVRRVGTVRHFLADGREESMPIVVRQISPSGQILEVRANEKFDARGLFIAEADGSDHRLLASVEEMIALSPERERVEAESLSISLPNCKWNADGSRAFVVFVGRNEQGRKQFAEVMTINPDGTGLTFVAEIEHHPIWHPDGERILFNGSDGMYLVNWDGTGLQKVADCNMGHPSVSPDGSTIVTDGYGRGEWRDALWLIDVETGEARKLCNVPNVHGRQHQRGTQPHPVWSHDGTRVLYDSDESGRSQLYEVEVND